MASKRIVIIGGVAGGASAAARCRRLDENASIVIFEKGPDPSFANCGMPYYLGGEIKDRARLNIQTPETLKGSLALDVRVLTEVMEINRDKKTVSVKEYVSGKLYDEPYDELILSVGAKPFVPPIPGIDRPGNFALRNLTDMDKIDNWIKDNGAKTAVVAGGGFIGVEMAEQLHQRGLTVTLVEAMPQIMGPMDEEFAFMLHEELEKNKVRVIVNDAIATFDEPKGGAKGSDIVLKSGNKLEADLVILGLGVRPETEMVKRAGIQCAERGGISVDDHLRTNDPHIWAVGDAIEVKNPILGGKWMVAMAGPANRQGRVVADNIFGKKREYKGTFGTSVIRVFSLDAACTGVNERTLRNAKLPYKAIHLHPMAHAEYYPGADHLSLKVVFNPEDGKVYGAQAVGHEGVDKRIDVIATAMQAGMTIEDFGELELCYAPPFGSAKDPVNLAGMMGTNVMASQYESVTWEEVPALAADPNVCILDVRTVEEVKETGLVVKPNGCAGLNIPEEELRERLGELDKSKRQLVCCLTGQRAYYASRLLTQRGFTVSQLSGAKVTWDVALHLKAMQSAAQKAAGN
eukprot:3430141-Rhodomonas_salina.2